MAVEKKVLDPITEENVGLVAVNPSHYDKDTNKRAKAFLAAKYNVVPGKQGQKKSTKVLLKRVAEYVGKEVPEPVAKVLRTFAESCGIG
jgi:hypothetical protein